MLKKSSYAHAWYRNLLHYWKKHGSQSQYALIRSLLFISLHLRGLLDIAKTGLVQLTQKQRTASRLNLEYAKALFSRAYLGEQPLNEKHVLRECHAELPISTRDLIQNGTAKVLRSLGFRRAQVQLPPQGSFQKNASGASEVDHDLRQYFSEKLSGRGLEIGPLHRPMPLHSQIQVDYLDRKSVPELREQYPELSDFELVEPDIIDDGGLLSTVSESSYDFIVSAHLIEHLRNPIAGLENWHRVVRNGGYIYLVVPDKAYTFDRTRARTLLEHMILDYYRPSKERDFDHFLDYSEHATQWDLTWEEIIREANSLADRDYCIHFHVFLPEDISNLISWFSKNIAQLEVKEGPVKNPGADEFHMLLQVKKVKKKQLLLEPSKSSGL